MHPQSHVQSFIQELNRAFAEICGIQEPRMYISSTSTFHNRCKIRICQLLFSTMVVIINGAEFDILPPSLFHQVHESIQPQQCLLLD